jgi:predicted nucleic acid-binding protein
MPVPRVYWESSVFISRIQGTPGRIDVLRQITDQAERGEIEIATSTVTLAEVARVDEDLLPEEQERLIVEFFENPYIIIRQVDRIAAERTRTILRGGGLRSVDAIHVASALLMNCPVMHTYDGGLLRRTGQFGSPPLRIEEPSWAQGQPPLFSETDEP